MLMDRYKRRIYYCLENGIQDIYDPNTEKYLGKRMTYQQQMPLDIHVGWARGTADTDPFGISLDYDMPMVTNWLDCPVTEGTVLFVDKEPEFRDGMPLYDCIVKRVARSKNYITYAIKKVSVS